MNYTTNGSALALPYADGIAQTCVTSPPYYGLRRYLPEGHPSADMELGTEQTPAAYVAQIVAAMREVWRVLRDDGTLWLNLGDSYAANGTRQNNTAEGKTTMGWPGQRSETLNKAASMALPPVDHGLKPKDLMGIPWRVAFALQDDGWYLRSDIIWAKPNPMPESVTDRPTKAHEYVFLFAKGQRKTRIVKLANIPAEFVHFSKDIGAHDSYVGTVKLCVGVAAAIFNGAQLQEEYSLPPFYAKEWKQGTGAGDSDFVRALPVKHRPTVWAARFLSADASTKQFLGELYSLGVTLSDGNKLLINGGVTEVGLPPSVFPYRDTSVTVNDSGQVCEFDFVHGAIISRSSAGCNYYYDAEAIREENQGDGRKRGSRETMIKTTTGIPGGGKHNGFSDDKDYEHSGRNARSVWNIATQPFSGSHFATMPPELARRCILAGSSARGQCPKCGSPWVRVMETERKNAISRQDRQTATGGAITGGVGKNFPETTSVTTGWAASCECRAGDPVPQIVLDPFAGSGTTAMVALQNGRRAIGTELNPAYLRLQDDRTQVTMGLGF